MGLKREVYIMSICLADNLKLMRNKYGYTLEGMAEIISVSRQTVAKWESGESYPDIINCQKLATLYKVSLDELVNKPLSEMAVDEFNCKNDRLCGILDVSENGSIHIPEPVLEMFDIHPGEKIMLLADKRQGMALVKCSQFD
jgi:transcriptional regulator with XRE-family HTH domain